MDEAMVRANLLIAGQVVVRDRAGVPSVVLVRRPTDPRTAAWVRGTNWYLTDLAFARLVRWMRRDRRWNVEVVPGADSAPDLRFAVVQATVLSRDAAFDRAVRVADVVQRSG